MALCDIGDINLEISSWIIDFKLFISLSILNKKSYVLIINTSIYEELNKLKNYDTNLELNSKDIINIYYGLGLINLIKKLKKNNEHFVSDNSINCAAENGHINILQWFKNSNLELKYSKKAINGASKNGNINILEW